LGIFDHRSNAGLLHEHVRDEYDHNGSDCCSDYCSDYWKGTGYASSNAKLYGGPLDFYAIALRFWRMLPAGRLWYGDTNAVANAISYAKFFSRSHDAVIPVYDDAGNVIEAHEHKGDFKQW